PPPSPACSCARPANARRVERAVPRAQAFPRAPDVACRLDAFPTPPSIQHQGVPSMSRIAADYLAETLAASGVKRIYGVVGDSLNGLTDSLRRIGTVDWVHMRHEEGAAFAAGAEAQLTGEAPARAGRVRPAN